MTCEWFFSEQILVALFKALYKEDNDDDINFKSSLCQLLHHENNEQKFTYKKFVVIIYLKVSVWWQP